MGGRITPILVTLICVLLLFSACSLLRKRTPAQRLAQLQKDVASKRGVVFSTELKGSTVSFLLLECNLYMLDASTDKISRTKVLSPDLYIWFTVCLEQSIQKDGEYVRVSLRRQAVGAGGGNAGGGNYRSKDGVNWEKHTSKGWLAVAEAHH